MRKRLMKAIAATILSGLSYAQQVPPNPAIGTLIRVESGERYVGTRSGIGIEAPIVRTDQVYMINGGAMEYTVVERNASPAHVVINDAIAYWLVGDVFYFLDLEGRPHPARIARQVLVDPNLRTLTIPIPSVASAAITPQRTVWTEVNGGARYSVSPFGETFYAVQIVSVGGVVPVRMEATWRTGENQYVGKRYWTVGKCNFDREVNFRLVSEGRIEGKFVSPALGVKLDRKHCRYKRAMAPFPLTLVRE